MGESVDFNNLNVWLGERLKECNISKEQLANDAGLSRASIYFYMTDKARPSEQAMARICQVVGAPLEEGLKQYVPKKAGRPKGSKNLATSVTAHQ